MTPPKIGQHWLEEQGIYAGLARGFDGEPDGHIVLLDVMPEKQLNWAKSMAWAISLGDGARLPNRREMELIGANISDKVGKNGYHWSASECSTAAAWAHTWNSTGPSAQHYSSKSIAHRARAIRRLTL